MDIGSATPVLAVCSACGALAVQHPYVKPRSHLVGWVCSRCGQVRGPRRDWGMPKIRLSDLELTGEGL